MPLRSKKAQLFIERASASAPMLISEKVVTGGAVSDGSNQGQSHVACGLRLKRYLLPA